MLTQRPSIPLYNPLSCSESSCPILLRPYLQVKGGSHFEYGTLWWGEGGSYDEFLLVDGLARGPDAGTRRDRSRARCRSVEIYRTFMFFLGQFTRYFRFSRVWIPRPVLLSDDLYSAVRFFFFFQRIYLYILFLFHIFSVSL